MICLRCGQCCLHLDIFVVNPSSILADGGIDTDDQEAMIFKPAGKRCPHLAHQPDRDGCLAVCTIHHLPCYRGISLRAVRATRAGGCGLRHERILAGSGGKMIIKRRELLVPFPQCFRQAREPPLPRLAQSDWLPQNPFRWAGICRPGARQKCLGYGVEGEPVLRSSKSVAFVRIEHVGHRKSFGLHGFDDLV